jgi:hypothetical protein
MASEAVIDCREFNILATEEVEDLKKVRGNPSADLMSQAIALGAPSSVIASGSNE